MSDFRFVETYNTLHHEEHLRSPGTSKEELHWLYAAANEAARSFPAYDIVELGSAFGMTAMLLGQAMIDTGTATGRVYTVDDCSEERFIGAQANIAKCGYEDQVQFVKSDDIAFMKALADESLSMVYVDSLHTYAHVSEVMPLVLPKMVPGGLICGHDYTWLVRGVVRAVEKWRRANASQVYGWGVYTTVWWTIKRGGETP